MRKTFTILAAIGCLFSGAAFAQVSSQRTCGTLEAIADLQQSDPGYKLRMDQNEVAIARFLSNPANRSRLAVTNTIPVVFHVVYANIFQNIPDAALRSQLEILNRDFRRMNADTSNTPAAFLNLGADTGIEFCLASVDPNGQPTTGITRTATTVSAFNVNNGVKSSATGGKDPWPRDQYLNIWVCNLVNGILGFATPPGGSAASDGVVLLYTSVGEPPHNTFGGAFNRGRTATHEVGHWLNLKHIWGDEPACAVDDLVADTPLQKDKNFGCPSYPQSISAGGVCAGAGPSSLFMNYMDYTNDACMYMFTKGQRDRMIAALNVSRGALANSIACQNTLAANFTASPTTVMAGGTVNFTSTSGGAPTGYSWSFPGAAQTTASTQNPSVVYNIPGTYAVTLTVTNATGTNTRTIPGFITVTNPSSCSDTLNLPFPGQDTLYISSNAGINNGYVSGNNGSSDKAKAEYFSNTGGANQVTGSIFNFGVGKAASAASAVIVTVWDNTGTGGKPGAIIGSQTLPISTIAANLASNSLTTVTFTNPVAVSGPFYMGVQLSNTPGDTVALVTNKHNNSPAGRGWEQASNNTWDSYSNSRGLNISNAIFPIVNTAPPVVNFTATPNPVCAGSTVTFNAGTTGATSYLWSFPGGTPKTSTAANPTVTYSTPGSFNVSLAARTTACSMLTTVNRQNAITVEDVTANFTTSATNINLANSTGQVTFTNTSTNANFYTWDFGDPSAGQAVNTSSLRNPPPYIYTTPGVYTVTLTTSASSGGCSKVRTATITVVNTTGLEEAFENGAVKIYPNPAYHYVQVEVPERQNATEISLTNTIGQIVESQKPEAGKARLDVSNLPAGIYFVRIANAEGAITKKISIIP